MSPCPNWLEAPVPAWYLKNSSATSDVFMPCQRTVGCVPASSMRGLSSAAGHELSVQHQTAFSSPGGHDASLPESFLSKCDSQLVLSLGDFSSGLPVTKLAGAKEYERQQHARYQQQQQPAGCDPRPWPCRMRTGAPFVVTQSIGWQSGNMKQVRVVHRLSHSGVTGGTPLNSA